MKIMIKHPEKIWKHVEHEDAMNITHTKEWKAWKHFLYWQRWYKLFVYWRWWWRSDDSWQCLPRTSPIFSRRLWPSNGTKIPWTSASAAACFSLRSSKPRSSSQWPLEGSKLQCLAVPATIRECCPRTSTGSLSTIRHCSCFCNESYSSAHDLQIQRHWKYRWGNSEEDYLKLLASQPRHAKLRDTLWLEKPQQKWRGETLNFN